MDESLDNRPDMPTGCPEATTAQPSTSDSDLHTVPPMPTDIRADETQTLTTTGVRKEGVPAPATMEESLLSTPAPPTDETQALTTTGVHEEGVPAPATMEESLLSTPAPPTDETQALTTTGVREEGVPAPATMEESLLSTPAPPTNASLPEVPPQLANGPAPKKRKVAARAIISDSISDK
jgi:hypothetical protein